MQKRRLTQHFKSGVAVIALICSVNIASAQETQPAPEKIAQLVTACAPQVHPNTMLKILKHESGFQPYLIGVNETPHKTYSFKSAAEAARKARELIAQGKSIDMGLGQINSANLPALKMTPEQVFEPCENIRASAYILTQAYKQTSAQFRDERDALDHALSIYNTGKTHRGIANGYVSKVRATRYAVPALDAAQSGAPAAVEEAEPDGPPPSWDVFAVARYRGPREAAARTEAPQAQQTASAEPTAAMLLVEPN